MSKSSPASESYHVFARKYRPGRFDELIGQDAVVQTLTNAITSGRLAHAYVFTGVRGVGKTTTARLLARALNCVGKDGKGDVTIDPCGVCDNCIAIAESRHVDVLEMDAASRTGVDDVREIIESVRYAPSSARYKVYIIDEVHMLSKNAFNALLKTLEEPPPHVKFVFATTEIRKLPVTVLSRCQRFDLRRVDMETLSAHLSAILKKEESEAEDGALRLIVRAAEGSVRDALSLLDQALAHMGSPLGEEETRKMLGLTDRAGTLDLFETMSHGDAGATLKLFGEAYAHGADPVVVLRDLLEVCHWVTRLKIVPDAGSDALVSESERDVGARLAGELTLADLSRTWQLLLKGVEETLRAPDPLTAAEMVLIRTCFATGLPTPAEILKRLDSADESPEPAKGNGGTQHARETTTATPETETPRQTVESSAARSEPASPTTASAGKGQVLALKPAPAGDAPNAPMPISFEALVELVESQREGILGAHLRDDVSLIKYRPGLVEFSLVGKVPVDFSARLRTCLESWTGSNWQIVVSTVRGEPTMREQDEARRETLIGEIQDDPLVAKVLDTFEGASIGDIRKISPTEREGDD